MLPNSTCIIFQFTYMKTKLRSCIDLTPWKVLKGWDQGHPRSNYQVFRRVHLRSSKVICGVKVIVVISCCLKVKQCQRSVISRSNNWVFW